MILDISGSEKVAAYGITIITSVSAVFAFLKTWFPPKHIIDNQKIRAEKPMICESSQHMNRFHERLDRLTDAQTNLTININRLVSMHENQLESHDRSATASDMMHRNTAAGIERLTEVAKTGFAQGHQDHEGIDRKMVDAINAINSMRGATA